MYQQTRIFLLGLCALMTTVTLTAQTSPTEGTINTEYIGEEAMMQSILEMVAKNMTYAKSIYTTPTNANNSKGEPMGYFRGTSAGQSNEDGVRTNADYSFICAFLYKYGKPEGVTLPAGITWDNVKEWAIRSLTYGYSTHCALDLARCTDGRTWGSAGVSIGSGQPRYTWESSLWAQSLAFVYWMLHDELTPSQRASIKTMICEEADLQLTRTIPHGYLDDTKSEENGWDTNILACAVALFPNEAKADAWYLKMRQFAMTTYSINQDKYDTSLVDGKPVKDWYIGTNLFDDYTLQNHAFFHTSYQNIAIQELSESYMTLAMMQEGNKYPLTPALKHNVRPMWDNVLKYLAMADGELAMPNGNDWSMFLFDQLASYTAMACIYRDPDALMLENMAFKYTRARQATTNDGAWMLNSDIGGRRMGVTGRRVVMTYLYHKNFSTADMQPSTWEDFSARHETTRYYPYVNVIRSNTKDRLTVFSWAGSKRSYTGMLGTSSPDKNKIFIPYTKGNMGNFTGFFQVAGKNTTATPTVRGNYAMFPNAYTMNGQLSMCGASLDQRFVLYSTSGNAVIYLYDLYGLSSGTMTIEGGGLMGVSTDPFTNQTRTLYYKGGNYTGNGAAARNFTSPWVNIDNEVGIIVGGDAENTMSFRNRSLVNSIYTTELYPIYNATETALVSGRNAAARQIIYYSNVTSAQTQALSEKVQVLGVPAGWNAVIVPDPDGTHYLLLANFKSLFNATLNNILCPEGAPVFKQTTILSPYGSSSTFAAAQNYSVSDELKVFVQTNEILRAVQEDGNSSIVYLHNDNTQTCQATVSIVTPTGIVRKSITIPGSSTQRVALVGNDIDVQAMAAFPDGYRNIARGTHVYANSQLPANMPFLTLDGDVNTYWQSLHNPTESNEHLTYRLHNAYTVNQVIITPVNSDTAPLTVDVQTSNTDDNFTSRMTATLANNGEPQTIDFAPVSARFVRLRILNAAGEQVAISEVQIMGTPIVPAPQPSGIGETYNSKSITPIMAYRPNPHTISISPTDAIDAYAGLTIRNVQGQTIAKYRPIPHTPLNIPHSPTLLLLSFEDERGSDRYIAKLPH